MLLTQISLICINTSPYYDYEKVCVLPEGLSIGEEDITLGDVLSSM